MVERRDGGARWVSYHVFPFGDIRTFLLARMLPGVLDARRQCLIRRFFFIRYSEGGPHVRIRLLPRVGVTRDALRALFDPGPDGRFEPHSYSRTDHYFGDTTQSVYAELLNERTSWMALRLLMIASPRRRWLTLASLLHRLLEADSYDPTLGADLLGESRRFAATAALRYDVNTANSRSYAPRARIVASAITAGVMFDADSSFVTLLRLLKRVRRLERGRCVATHALHLLCNKVGLTIGQELDIFESLAEAVAMSESPS